MIFLCVTRWSGLEGQRLLKNTALSSEAIGLVLRSSLSRRGFAGRVQVPVLFLDIVL